MQSKTPLDIRLIRLLRCVIGLLMLAAVGVNCANVVDRYVFLKPFVWAEEVMQFMHLWMVLLGAAILTGHGTHLKMDAVYILVSLPVRRLLDVLTNLLGILVSLYIIVSATQIIQMLAANDQPECHCPSAHGVDVCRHSPQFRLRDPVADDLVLSPLPGSSARTGEPRTSGACGDDEMTGLASPFPLRGQ